LPPDLHQLIAATNTAADRRKLVDYYKGQAQQASVANCTRSLFFPSVGWSKVPLGGLRNACGCGRTARENSTPACSSSISPSSCCYSEDYELALSEPPEYFTHEEELSYCYVFFPVSLHQLRTVMIGHTAFASSR
jgi:hypothetical protein